jgi:hypothetical protein
MSKEKIELFENKQIRKIIKNGESWISAIDVAYALEYSNPSVTISQTIQKYKDRFNKYSLINKTLIYDKNGKSVRKETLYLNLKGVIAFCMISKQPKAVPFQRWADGVIEKEISNINPDIRLIAKKRRLDFTDQLKAHGYKAPHEYIQTTRQMKAALNIDPSKQKKECDLIEVMKIATAEMLSYTKLAISEAIGYHEVNPVCVKSSEEIRKSILTHSENYQKYIEKSLT